VKDGFNKLNGASEPVQRLSNSSNFESARSKQGHYNDVVNVVIPWLRANSAQEISQIIGEGEDGTRYRCTEYGQVICKEEHSHLKLWKTAFLEEPLPMTEEEFARPLKDSDSSEIVGLDRRFGTLILLYAQVTVRPWLKTLEAMN
jgi:hypothetical protein